MAADCNDKEPPAHVDKKLEDSRLSLGERSATFAERKATNTSSMMTFPRQRQNEQMDDPAIEPRAHEHALAGLRRINLWSLSSRTIWHSIRTHLAGQRRTEFRILDLACGSGDVSLALTQRAIDAGYQVKLTGCDKSPIAIATARDQATRQMQPNRASYAEFIELDVLNDPLPIDHDIVMTSLFLHHLDSEDAIKFLSRMAAATRDLVLVDDLRRTRFGYYLAWFGSRLLSRSPVVHFDGPVSVGGAFTTTEALEMPSARLAQRAVLLPARTDASSILWSGRSRWTKKLGHRSPAEPIRHWWTNSIERCAEWLRPLSNTARAHGCLTCHPRCGQIPGTSVERCQPHRPALFDAEVWLSQFRE